MDHAIWANTRISRNDFLLSVPRDRIESKAAKYKEDQERKERSMIKLIANLRENYTASEIRAMFEDL